MLRRGGAIEGENEMARVSARKCGVERTNQPPREFVAGGVEERGEPRKDLN